VHRNSLHLIVLGLSAGLIYGASTESLMYVGTYTGKGSEGIYAYRFNSKSGALKSIGLVAKSSNPSFFAISPDEKVLYSVSEGKEGILTAYSINARTGALTELNHSSTRGGGPCFVSIDKTNHTALVANYGGGSVASFRIEPGGKLSDAVSFIQHHGSSANPSRQKEPHAHSINVSPDNRFAVTADLGTDELIVYRLDAATAQLTPNDPPATKLTPGDGPRHFTFHSNRRFAYVINELHSTVTPLTWDAAKGTLTPGEPVSTLPSDFSGENTTAEVLVHPNGKWLYGSNRGHDSIAVFEINAGTGKPKLVENAATGGNVPRNFRIDPTGRWLIAENQSSNNMRVFRIAQKNGRLTPSGEMIELVSPVCIKFVRAK
jgi:6-phosphogluconolactonase